MKIIGIVGRAYYNRDDQKIFQINEAIRKAFSSYEDVAVISILPTNQEDYVNMEMGKDKIDSSDSQKLDAILDICDGFVVPGGTFWYRFDEYVMEHAIKRDKPLLAICLGFQALCSMYARGRTGFDMTKKLLNDAHYGPGNAYIHSIQIKDDTLLQRIVGEKTIPVNSIHHDYMDCELRDLVVSAVSEDGVLEAVELPNHQFILGLQWHPEYLMDEYSKKILDSFVQKLK